MTGQIPKPNGMGMTGKKTSSEVSSPFATAFGESSTTGSGVHDALWQAVVRTWS